MHKIVRLIVASGEQCADLRYAAGFSTPDEFIYFDDGTRRGVVMSALEYGRAVHSAPRDVEVHAETEFGRNRLEILSGIASMLRSGVFLVPADFPLALADRLRLRAGCAASSP